MGPTVGSSGGQLPGPGLGSYKAKASSSDKRGIARHLGLVAAARPYCSSARQASLASGHADGATRDLEVPIADTSKRSAGTAHEVARLP